MADEDTVLEETMENLKEAGQRIRATQSLVSSQGMTEGDEMRELARKLGLRGGLKGGPVRKDKLSSEWRKEIAKKAAEARWAKKCQQEEASS
jgi:hypothetical protein